MMTSKGTLYFDFVNGVAEQVYPCRCGQTHRGDYAFYDWMHHNCYHDSPLVQVVPDEDPSYLMCMDCGKTFTVEGPGRKRTKEIESHDQDL